MEYYREYQPLRWPPILPLAELHLQCSGPGKDNIEGVECPCCNRFQKIKTNRWWSRSINKDFKCYGGGIPAYFQLIKYFVCVFIILSLLLVIFHIYVVELVCIDADAKCSTVLGVFKLCNSNTIYQILNREGHTSLATGFAFIQMVCYLLMIVSTIGMKLWLNYINNKKIVKQNKIFRSYSLMVKNIPKDYAIGDVQKEIQELIPGIEICELFFVYSIAEFETKYKELLDLYFEIKFTDDSIKEERGGSLQELNELIQKFTLLYQELDGIKNETYKNNGRAIVVFNSRDHKEQLYKQLKIGEFTKFVYHTGKLFGKNTKELHIFADSIPEPQEIIWKYIGESSVAKTKVRIQTTAIILTFMAISFGLLFFPIYEINKAKIENPAVGTGLNILISIGLVVLSVAYRMYVIRLLSRRKPSSRQAEAYFVIINTVIFHFLFYLVAPIIYYFYATGISANAKLAQFFFAVLLFLILNIVIALIDIRYRIFKKRRRNLIENWSQWGKLCQARLHEELKYPSFPIEFKIMFILNIWSFNAFYLFQIPYLLVLFSITLTFVYWVDKRNIYRHYKMQVYLSIQMQLSVQRDYIFFFLICVSCGYAVTVIYHWQYYVIGVVFIISIALNYFISFKRKGEKLGAEKQKTLFETLRTQSIDPKQCFIHEIMESDNKQRCMALDTSFSTRSVGSVTFEYGYNEEYDNYINQFKNKAVNKLLDGAYTEFMRSQRNNNANETQMKNMNETGIQKGNETQMQRTSHIPNEID